MCARTGHETDIYLCRLLMRNLACLNVTGGEYNITAKRTARSAILKGLEQGAYYHVKLRADSEWGNSDYSEAIVARVPNPWQHSETFSFSLFLSVTRGKGP